MPQEETNSWLAYYPYSRYRHSRILGHATRHSIYPDQSRLSDQFSPHIVSCRCIKVLTKSQHSRMTRFGGLDDLCPSRGQGAELQQLDGHDIESETEPGCYNER